MLNTTNRGRNLNSSALVCTHLVQAGYLIHYFGSIFRNTKTNDYLGNDCNKLDCSGLQQKNNTVNGGIINALIYCRVKFSGS